MSLVRFVYNESAMRAILESREVLDRILSLVEPVAVTGRELAPKDTGAGAASIGTIAGVDAAGSYAHVGWDREHYYMIFPHEGTQRIPARPFLEDALERYER